MIRRLFRWICAVLILAALLVLSHRVFAAPQDDCDTQSPGEDCAVVYWPGICHWLEPYSYWWYAFYCDEEEAGVTAESVGTMPLTDRQDLVHVRREYVDGSVREFWFIAPHGGRR